MGKDDRIILIDSDVVSHFITGCEIISLPTIVSPKIKILDKVYSELKRFPKKRAEVDNLLHYKLLEQIPFPESDDEIKKEYAYIKKIMFKGDGEAACLAVAKKTNCILASSNLKDIQIYCHDHTIDYLTTMDFLCEAMRKGIFDLKRCNDFIAKVLASGSKLPVNKMEHYTCRTISFL